MSGPSDRAMESIMGQPNSHTPLNGFRDPNEVAVRRTSIRLLREILDYQRTLTGLLERADADTTDRADACRREIRIRRQLLRDLPQPVDREIPEPWSKFPTTR